MPLYRATATLLANLVAADGSSGGFLKDSQYVEGTWTPALTFSTPGDLSVTHTVQSGLYRRIGNIIVASFQINTSAFTHSTASGNLTVTGLPVTVVTDASSLSHGSVMWEGITKANFTNVTMVASSNTTTAIFVACGSGQDVSSIAVADVPSGGTPRFRGTLVYFA